MPLSGIQSFLPTLDEFIAHWTQVNAAASDPAEELRLKGNYALADLIRDRAALQAATLAVIDAENTRQMAAAQRDMDKKALRQRLSQFRGAVQSLLQGTAYEVALPTLPPLSALEARYLAPFDDAALLWERINSDTSLPDFTPPLTLGGGYTRDNLVADIAKMRTTFLLLTNAEATLRLMRNQRDSVLPAIRQRLNQYRAAMRANFTTTDPFVQSLPALSLPARPPRDTPETETS